MARKPEKPELSADYLWSILDYSPKNGTLIWKRRPTQMFTSERVCNAWNTKHVGKMGFRAKGKHGHLYGAIWGQKLLSHRIIFKMMTGRDPVAVDHINGDPGDNRWSNLREANQTTNMRNAAMPKTNTSGHVGVYWFKDRYKWVAAIKINKRFKNLGYFEDIEDAIAARRAAERVFGFHPNHGRAPHGEA